jgi:phosphoribosylaminoimidazole-succinocarboxamide synthase
MKENDLNYFGEKTIIVNHDDEASAYGGTKKAIIEGKGILNNKISSRLFAIINAVGVPNHFLEKLDDRRQLCRKTAPIEVKIVARNHATEDFLKLFPFFKLGEKFEPPIYDVTVAGENGEEIPIGDEIALKTGKCARLDLTVMRTYALAANNVLSEIFSEAGIILAEIRFAFGRTPDEEILLTGELTPDTCRLWDKKTREKLDLDRFRYDLGRIIESYENIWQRLRENE